MRRASVVVVGSSCIDMVVQVDRIPKVGETVLGGDFTSTPGGKGANQAVAAARAGADVSFIGRVGKDEPGKRIVAGLAADGINVANILRDATTPSGVALIFLGSDGANSI